MSTILIDRVDKLNEDLRSSSKILFPKHFGLRIIALNEVYGKLKEKAEQKKDEVALDHLRLYIENREYLLEMRCRA